MSDLLEIHVKSLLRLLHELRCPNLANSRVRPSDHLFHLPLIPRITTKHTSPLEEQMTFI